MRRVHDRVGIAVLLLVAACKRSPSESLEPAGKPQPASTTTPSGSSLPNGATAALHFASPSAASSASAPPEPGVVHCKAVGRRGPVPIGTLREAPIAMLSEGDSVYVFTFHQPLASVTLSRIRRDGSPTEVIGRHTAGGEPKSPILAADAAYLLLHKTVIRIPRDGSASAELARGFTGAIAVHGGFVYGVACEPKTPPDHLQRVSTQGGKVERLQTLERVPAREQDGAVPACDYHSIIADGAAVYAASWNGRRILRVSLGDGSVTPLATKKAFPSSLAFDGEDLLFQAAGGLYRVAKQQPEATRISELGSAPFTYVAHAGPITYIHQSEPYMPEEWTYELVRATGKTKKLDLYRALDPRETPPDTGIRALAVDDECLYTARQQQHGIVLYARSR